MSIISYIHEQWRIRTRRLGDSQIGSTTTVYTGSIKMYPLAKRLSAKIIGYYTKVVTFYRPRKWLFLWPNYTIFQWITTVWKPLMSLIQGTFEAGPKRLVFHKLHNWEHCWCPKQSSISIKVFRKYNQTMARGTNPARAAIPSGRKEILSIIKKLIFSKTLLISQNVTHPETILKYYVRCSVLELLYNSSFGPLAKKFVDPCPKACCVKGLR